MMRVAYISHSLVAERQQYFAEELRKQLQALGGDLLEIYPAKWSRHERVGGYPVFQEGDHQAYSYYPATWQSIRDWKPDLILVQQEPYCLVSYTVQQFCKRLEIPYIVFTWDNLNVPQGVGLDVLMDAKIVVAGNTDAVRLMQPFAQSLRIHVAPQVGINPEVFYPRDVENKCDILFMGRRGDPMKGEAILDQATHNSGWLVRKGYELGFAAYQDLPERYSQARLQCTPSLDVPGRPREQWAPATTIEGLFCGVPVVTTDQAAIREWVSLSNQGGAWFAAQGDADSLKRALRSALDDCSPDGLIRRGKRGREWAMGHFTNAVVAKEYVELFKEALS